jgi:aryl sulfotransferase
MPIDVASLRPYRSAIFDNRRWASFDSRPGDIFVCAPPKCGTTWMQTIVAEMLWPDGDAPRPVMLHAPWLEGEFTPLDQVLAQLAAQKHRRTVKTHTPADGIPLLDDTKYIFVARDGRDAFMSLCNQGANLKAAVVEALNARAPADSVRPMPSWSGDVHGFFARWTEEGAFLDHVATFWQRRDLPNLLLVHYNDLKADLDGEMRRIAGFLDIRVPEAQWPAVVERCTFESMKARPEEIGTFEIFEGGANSFLYKGSNGRWRDVLSPQELTRYEQRVAKVLPPHAARWLEHGRGA